MNFSSPDQRRTAAPAYSEGAQGAPGQRAAVKAAAAHFRGVIDGIAAQTAKTRELSLARTKIEEAEMWALRHIDGAQQ